jgi:hypothetical protein
MADVRFYCVADARYFPGAVALINSIRLVGHREPIVVLDCGLSQIQRHLLEGEVELITRPAGTPPWLLKTIAPLERPADAMVLLDADLVLTSHLGELIRPAAEGRMVAFRNPVDRFVPEWGALLGLGEARRGAYLSTAALVTDRELGVRVLGLMDEKQSIVDFERTHWRANEAAYAFTFADQDVFNGILATVIDRDQVEALDERLAPTPPFAGLQLLDERSLRCAYEDGTQPYLVHHHVVKPWLEPTHHGIYSRLLRRLLIGDELAVRIPSDEIPPHLRRGPGAALRRTAVNVRERLRWHVLDPVRALRGGKRS